MEKILKIINNEMKKLGIDYYYLTNTSPEVVYPYVTGEYNEGEYSYEDGSNHGEMLLEAWQRNSNLNLVKLNDKIKEHFKDFRIVFDGIAAHISYAGNYPRRTNDANLFKLEIHLDIVYWEGA